MTDKYDIKIDIDPEACERAAKALIELGEKINEVVFLWMKHIHEVMKDFNYGDTSAMSGTFVDVTPTPSDLKAKARQRSRDDLSKKRREYRRKKGQL